MALLIDGYNLLNASGILPRGAGAGTLHRARGALLNFLSTAVDPSELPQTTIVFDASDAPPGLPDVYDYCGMTVRFARGYDDADELLTELIRADSAPRRLTVVSSDHQVQRAARRRRAKAVDSDRWCAELLRDRRLPLVPLDESESKPPAPLSPLEVQRWLKEFGDVELRGEALQPPRRRARAERDASAPAAPQVDDASAAEQQPRYAAEPDLTLDEAKRQAEEDRNLANPFPPGYGEDLLHEEG
jgi:predicted RNA-binding protein with PIN domain